jgi:hypothetical protein
MNKLTRPDYVPLDFWIEFQELDANSLVHSAFKRVIFGDGKYNTARAMKTAWIAIEAARYKRWVDFLDKCETRCSGSESFDIQGRYKALAMHVKNLAYMKNEDFLKMLTNKQRAAQLRETIKAGKYFLKLLENNYLGGGYSGCDLNSSEVSSLKKYVIDKSFDNQSKLFKIIQDARFEVVRNSFNRDLASKDLLGKAKDYFYSDECNQVGNERRQIVNDYEKELGSICVSGSYRSSSESKECKAACPRFLRLCKYSKNAR